MVGAILVYNVVEAVVVIWTGTEASSIALFGFSLDSVIGCAAAVTVQAVNTLVSRDHPDGRVVGIALAAVSPVVMPLLARGKFRTTAGLGSDALRAEAGETLACA